MLVFFQSNRKKHTLVKIHSDMYIQAGASENILFISLATFSIVKGLMKS